MTAAPGSFSEGFSTKVLPAVTATGNIHRGIMAGKLKGQIPAHTCVFGVNHCLSQQRMLEMHTNMMCSMHACDCPAFMHLFAGTETHATFPRREGEEVRRAWKQHQWVKPEIG